MAGEGYLAKIQTSKQTNNIMMQVIANTSFKRKRDFKVRNPLLTYKATETVKLSLVIYVS